MSLAVRVIPCLDVAGGRVVKGLKFENLRDAGDPVEAARRYEAEGADELCFLDVAASHEERGTLVGLVASVADVLSIPFTVGGGVRSVEDAGALLAAGADRVTVNTAAVADPALVTRLAERFGSQCVVVAVDAKRDGDRFVVSTHGGRRITGIDLASWVAEVTARGAGEILLTSMDADGTLAGFDLAMLKVARAVTSVPIVASGGAGALAHFAPAVLEGGADAVLAASIFHDRTFSVGQVKRALATAGVPVRPAVPAGLEGLAFDANGLVPVVVRRREDGRRPDARLGERGGPCAHGRDAPLPLLEPLAPRALEEGGDLGERPARRPGLGRLRPRRRPLRRRARGARLPHGRRELLCAHRGDPRASEGPPASLREPIRPTPSTSAPSSRSSPRGRRTPSRARTRTAFSRRGSRSARRRSERKGSRRPWRP